MDAATPPPPRPPTPPPAAPGTARPPAPPRGPAGQPLDVRVFQHPLEHARFLLALTATVVVLGTIILWVLFQAPEVVGPSILLYGFYFAFVAVFVWVFLLVRRAKLLGDSVRVSAETLPVLHAIVEEVRARLDFRRRADVYVSASVDSPRGEPIEYMSFFGTHVVLIEGGLVADLQDPEHRHQLEFLFGSVFGALKARQMQMTFLVALLEWQKGLRFLNVFLAPYFRATYYSGDQIGAMCARDIPSVVAMMNRRLVGKDLSPSLAARGVLDQAAQVQTRFLPRLAQLFMPKPHLANRYLNLMEFLAVAFPQEMDAYLQRLDQPTRERLWSVIQRSPHWHPPTAAKKSSQTFVAAAVMVAALAVSAVLALAGRAAIGDPAPAGGGGIQTPGPAFDPSPGPVQTPTPSPPPLESFPSPVETSGAAFPDGLAGVVPGDMLAWCAPEGPALPGFLYEGALAAAYCTPPEADRVTFVQYESLDALQQAFTSIGLPSRAGPGCTLGPTTVSYTTGGVEAGTLACYTGPLGTEFAWTVDDQQVLVLMADGTLDYAGLYEVWTNFG